VLILLFFAYRPQIARSLVARVEQLLPNAITERVALTEWLEQMLLGLQPLTRPRQLGHAVLWTLISWAISLFSLYILHPGLPIDPDVNLWLNTTLSAALASFSIAIPVSVAAIGPFEAAIAVAGELTGINSVLYTALGFLIHGITVLGYVIIGVPGMLRLGVSFSEMLRRSDAPPAEQPEGVQ
jgi:uncharacterized membrane protein YbhN (UPF0104 family)